MSFFGVNPSADNITYGTGVEAALAQNTNSAGGLPVLDSAGKILLAQLPPGALQYKGTWSAVTNTPTLADGTGSLGDSWIASDSASRNLGSGVLIINSGDWLVYNGAIWQLFNTGNIVDSVFGRVGNVTAGINDYTWAQIDKTTSSLGDLTTRSAGDLSSGTLNDLRLSSSVTVQGNTFNGTSQLVQMTAATKLPAVDGSLLIGTVEEINFSFPGTTASNNTFILMYKAKVACVINNISVATTSGTCTLAVIIAGSNVTWTGSITTLSVTASDNTISAISGNTITAGQQVAIVITANSSATNLAGTMQTTRN